MYLFARGAGQLKRKQTQPRLSSEDFPKLFVRCQGEETRVKETERIVGEVVTRKTEEVSDPVTGIKSLRTVEYTEKTIEKEVLTFSLMQV